LKQNFWETPVIIILVFVLFNATPVLSYVPDDLDFVSMGDGAVVGALSGKTKKKHLEDEVYASAKQAFDRGNLEVAREGFQKTIKQYPKSQHAGNAQFWIGEIYYREKWYEKAILEYQKVIEKYPKSNKVPASILKQGFAFLNLGGKPSARFFKEISSKTSENK
jgi:tol-pal system protein YbgF